MHDKLLQTTSALRGGTGNDEDENSNVRPLALTANFRGEKALNATSQQLQSPVTRGPGLQSSSKAPAEHGMTNFNTTNQSVQIPIEEMGKEELKVFEFLKSILASSALQHADLSDTGLTEAMILALSKTINKSTSLLSVHLSGNPGLKDHVIRKVQGKLKATYEEPLNKRTFKPLIRLFDNKFGRDQGDEKEKSPPNMRRSILDGIEERDSLSSASLYYHSERHNVDPEKLKEQIAYKNLLIEKEALVQLDDGKMSRDHKRHFMVQRVLGHDLEMPGASEW